ncbi:MAG: DNA gyrase subunit B, partial [Gammaproteobacteria bacterium]
YIISQHARQSLCKRFRPEVIDTMQVFSPLEGEACKDKNQVKAWFRELCNQISALYGVACIAEIFTLAKTGEHGGRITINIHGIEVTNIFTPDFFTAREYQDLVRLQRAQALQSGASVGRGEQSAPIDSIKKGFDWLLDKAATGLHVQRYKGLGEMNPDQLWETTMDASTRILSRVRIEDAVAADEIFTTLMGDQVEPRRDFIEKYALLAENLDT